MGRRFASLLLVTLVVGAAIAFTAAPALGRGGDHGVGRSTLVQAAATYIGVTKADLVAAKKAGQTPAQLAVAKGKTVQGLTNALVAAGTASINQARAAGRITAGQASAKIAALPAVVQAFINSTGGSCPGHG